MPLRKLAAGKKWVKPPLVVAAKTKRTKKGHKVKNEVAVTLKSMMPKKATSHIGELRTGLCESIDSTVIAFMEDSGLPAEEVVNVLLIYAAAQAKAGRMSGRFAQRCVQATELLPDIDPDKLVFRETDVEYEITEGADEQEEVEAYTRHELQRLREDELRDIFEGWSMGAYPVNAQAGIRMRTAINRILKFQKDDEDEEDFEVTT